MLRHSGETSSAVPGRTLQVYLAQKKHPPPYDRHSSPGIGLLLTVGSYGGDVSYERGTPVEAPTRTFFADSVALHFIARIQMALHSAAVQKVAARSNDSAATFLAERPGGELTSGS